MVKQLMCQNNETASILKWLNCHNGDVVIWRNNLHSEVMNQPQWYNSEIVKFFQKVNFPYDTI